MRRSGLLLGLGILSGAWCAQAALADHLDVGKVQLECAKGFPAGPDRAYKFRGIAGIVTTGGKGFGGIQTTSDWLEGEGHWSQKEKTATEKLMLEKSDVSIFGEFRCNGDPWITSTSCVVIEVSASGAGFYVQQLKNKGKPLTTERVNLLFGGQPKPCAGSSPPPPPPPPGAGSAQGVGQHADGVAGIDKDSLAGGHQGGAGAGIGGGPPPGASPARGVQRSPAGVEGARQGRLGGAQLPSATVQPNVQATVQVQPPLVTSPAPGRRYTDAVAVEVRPQGGVIRAYGLQFELQQGRAWRARRVHGALRGNGKRPARDEIPLNSFVAAAGSAPEAKTRWRMRARGSDPETGWSGWVEFDVAAPAPGRETSERLRLPQRHP